MLLYNISRLKERKEILSLVDRTERELLEQEEQVEGTIVIGSGELSAVEVLPEILESFHQKYPRVTYDLFTANADVVKEQIEKGLVDIGVLLEPVDVEKFDFIRLKKKERWIVLMLPDDPLAEKENISATDLEGKPLILPRRHNVRNEVLSWFGDSFQTTNILFTSNFSTNAAIMVRSGLGYSIAVEGSVPFLDKEKLTYRPLRPELTASCVFAWKKQQPFSLAATKFIEHMKCFLSINDV